jgi:outer membrane protein TolC
MKKILLAGLISVVVFQYVRAQNDVLDQYIQIGLKNNLALKQKQLSYEQSLAVLKEARSLFFPDIGLNARYSVADGGRAFEIPIGDLMNPVYSTLNQLIQQDRFNQVQNEAIPFLRPTEQVTKLSLIQPIYNPQIYYNYKIKKDLTNTEQISVDIYKRELIKEIKTAYFNYLKTVKALELLDLTLDVVRENVRVNQSLFTNDKVTMDVVYRSRAEFSKVEGQTAEAEKYHKTAAAYFNFLLNRSLDSSINTIDDELPDQEIMNVEKALELANLNREELYQLETYKDISEKYLKMNKWNKTPTLAGAFDYGIQGEQYDFNDKADYYLASLVLRWDLFKGFEKRSKIQQATIELDKINEKYSETEKQIDLQVIEVYYSLIAARKAVIAAKSRNFSSLKAFEMINKKYNQGQTSLLEFIDARTSATNAGLNLIMARFDYQIRYAEFERVLGLYIL